MIKPVVEIGRMLKCINRTYVFFFLLFAPRSKPRIKRGARSTQNPSCSQTQRKPCWLLWRIDSYLQHFHLPLFPCRGARSAYVCLVWLRCFGVSNRCSHTINSSVFCWKCKKNSTCVLWVLFWVLFLWIIEECYEVIEIHQSSWHLLLSSSVRIARFSYFVFWGMSFSSSLESNGCPKLTCMVWPASLSSSSIWYLNLVVASELCIFL